MRPQPRVFIPATTAWQARDHRQEVHPVEGVPSGLVGVLERPGHRVVLADGVHEHVDRSEGLLGAGHGVLDGSRHGQIGDHPERPTAGGLDRLDGAFDPFLDEIDPRPRGAVRGEELGTGGTDGPGPSGDQRHTIDEQGFRSGSLVHERAPSIGPPIGAPRHPLAAHTGAMIQEMGAEGAEGRGVPLAR